MGNMHMDHVCPRTNDMLFPSWLGALGEDSLTRGAAQHKVGASAGDAKIHYGAHAAGSAISGAEADPRANLNA